mmetsp:Transcript_23679/g.38578  ORF Transcript_23679/g.38578 Transcript_23679/m.38578 type:complete len:125 (-) Transcript_23679:499-873(-)
MRVKAVFVPDHDKFLAQLRSTVRGTQQLVYHSALQYRSFLISTIPIFPLTNRFAVSMLFVTTFKTSIGSSSQRRMTLYRRRERNVKWDLILQYCIDMLRIMLYFSLFFYFPCFFKRRQASSLTA